jgi:pullulanase/glycogen debranching enzyme
MEAARTSETLVNFDQTTRSYNPEDSHLRTHRCENLKSNLRLAHSVVALPHPDQEPTSQGFNCVALCCSATIETLQWSDRSAQQHQ